LQLLTFFSYKDLLDAISLPRSLILFEEQYSGLCFSPHFGQERKMTCLEDGAERAAHALELDPDSDCLKTKEG